MSDRDLAVIVLALLGLVVVLPLLLMSLGGMGMMYGGMGSGGMMGGPYGGTATGFSPVAVVLPLLVALLVLGGGYLLVRRTLGDGSTRDPALTELRQAYARGDLSDEEFDRRRAKLETED